jgi:hypothetical protein
LTSGVLTQLIVTLPSPGFTVIPPVGGGAALPLPPQAETSAATRRAASAWRMEKKDMSKTT